MPQVINTNIMSLNAQRQLNKSQLTQNEAMERLSSGLRINSAKDDAAGLAISTGMQSQIRGMNQAVRNANDGISMSQTSEGAMDEMTNILQRMRELSVQSANATNSDDNRDSIQTEVDQLYSELERISGTTQFNGINLLDGSASNVTLQIGANNGETMKIDFQEVTAHALGIDGGVTKGDLNGDRVDGSPILTDKVQINGIDIGPVDNANKLGAAGIAEAINKKTSETDVTADAYNSIEGAKGDAFTGDTIGLEITVGNGDTVTLGITNSMENLRDSINTAVPNLEATISADGQLQLTNDSGDKIKIGTASGGDISRSGLEAGTFEGYVALSSTGSDPIKVSGDETIKFGLMESNGAGSLQGATIATDSKITEDDKVTINGKDLVVTGAPLDTASVPPTFSDATTAEKVAAINTLTEETGVTATMVEITAPSVGFTLGTRSTVDFTVSDTDIAALAGDAALSSLKFGTGANVDMTTVTNLDTFANALNISSTDYTFEKNTAGTGLTVTAGTVGATTPAAFALVGTPVAGATAATALGTAVSPVVGTDLSVSPIVPGTYAIALTATEGTDIIVNSDAEDSVIQKSALGKLGMISTGGTKADDLGIDVTTAAHAGRSLDLIDEALGSISSARAELGAVQNRLGSTISNLENVSQNLSASNSRIQDADFAAETSKMSKAQILQQAGTSMLSQANASTQNVLSLLQG